MEGRPRERHAQQALPCLGGLLRALRLPCAGRRLRHTCYAGGFLDGLDMVVAAVHARSCFQGRR
eukprot:5755415-Alexandrium_andersonii.AAC.1